MRKLSFIALATVLLVSSCKEKSKGPDKFNPNAPVSVDIAIAETQSVDKTVEVNGTIIASDYVDLHPETNGRITFLQIPEGKMVNAGTVLAKLNDADLQAQLQKIKVQLELAQINEKRNKQLLTIKGINQSDYDISLQQVKSYEADAAYTQSLIDKTIIKAPFTGQIGLRQVSLGAFINTTTTIATLQKVSELKVDFTLPEMYQNYIKVGKKVKVQCQGTDVKYDATVFAVEPQIVATSRNLKVRAIIKGKMLPGSFAKVYISESNQKPVILVPSNVIIPDAKSKQLVIVKNGEAKFVDVETGYRTATSAEIVKGINPGDSVVVAGILFVRQGNKLKIGKTIKLTEIAK